MASFDMAMSGQTSQPKQKSYSKVLHTKRAIRGLICILFCLLSLLPFLLMVMNATRTSGDIQAGVSLIPSSHLVENWNMLLQKQNGMRLTLGRAMLNSLCITVPGTFLAVYCSCMTAYGIHVYNFKAKKFAWAFIMAIMMVPNQITIPCIAAPAVVFFMKQYMESTLSIEMIEAARIDGAREFRIFNTIIMPIMKPAVATQAIFQFIAQWNNLFTPTIMLTTDEKKTLPLFVQMLTSDQFRVDYGVVYVGLTVTVLPLIIAYLILSKYIVAGVALGGVKG